jgi:hypothetical protein
MRLGEARASRICVFFGHDLGSLITVVPSGIVDTSHRGNNSIVITPEAAAAEAELV